VAYVFIPAKTRKDKLAPKSELMVYLGIAPDNIIKGVNCIFMRSPNNVIFTSPHVLFDETCFPKCSSSKAQPAAKKAPTLSSHPEDIHIPDDPIDDNFAPSAPLRLPDLLLRFLPHQRNSREHLVCLSSQQFPDNPKDFVVCQTGQTMCTVMIDTGSLSRTGHKSSQLMERHGSTRTFSSNAWQSPQFTCSSCLI
jgi:hypothetical protein